jgi:hypothetical protein
MQTTAAVHCPGCGYDGNNPYFRYCGMCGFALRHEARTPPAPPVARPAPALTVDSYSILGLEDQSAERAIHADGARRSQPDFYEAPRHRADYLLDDDEPGSPRWRICLEVVLLLIGAGALAWQWQGSGYAAAVWSALSPASTRASHATPAAEAPVTAENSPATPAPGPTPAAAPTSDATSAPAATVAPVTAEAQPAPAASAAAPPSAVPQDNAAARVPPPEGNAPEAAAPAPNQTSRAAPDAAAGVDSDATGSTQSAADAVPASTKLAAISAADANQLFAEGQKYLYGNSVERDCGRALEDLRVAARLKAEAASLLGTMYASGHCVGQNLAPAYRWYARALHRDPGNTRYKSDLEVLWNQMTPQDRQAALRIAP